MRIERRSGLSRARFVEEFVKPNRPVVLTDLSAEWQAREKFTPEFFRRHYATLELDVRGKTYRLGDLLERLADEQCAPELYPCKLDLRDPRLGDLVSMVEPRPTLICPDRTRSAFIPSRFLAGLHDLEIFFGGAGGEFPYLHYDYLGLYAIINQLYGEKEFTLFAPEQQAYLYPKSGTPWISAIKDHHAPDLENYPLFKHASPTTLIIKPGESLFIPKKWYHTARSLGPTISVAMDQLCHFNWNQFTRECLASRENRPLKHFIARSYLRSIGAIMSLGERIGGSL